MAWEWCRNRFHPYPGFRAFPYDGYSLPWFDGYHYTLRGGSPYTLPWIRRASFRNFYAADKRHVFAGCRLAFDA
jgi:iron(II)-dependent oxidoreductase